MPDLTPDTVVRRAPNAVEAEVGGLKVMLDVDAGNYYGLDAVGTHVWELLAEPRPLGAIVDGLTARYEVGREEAEAATRAFVGDLVARGLAEAA